MRINTDRQETWVTPPTFSNMSAELAGYEWSRNTIGQSEGTVYHLHNKADAPELFLKHGRDIIADDVTNEMVRLRWLADYVPVPTVKHFVRTPDQAWLLMTAIPGKTAYQILASNVDTRFAVVDALVAFLHRLHKIPISACPFNSNHTCRLAHARARIDAGKVDVDDFDEERKGWTAEQVWNAMQGLLPRTPDQVVTHGDFSLDNLLIDKGRVVGCIDVGRVGVADRYQDLAILWRSLGEFDPSLQNRLFQQYGIANPDTHRLKFHLLLDELF